MNYLIKHNPLNPVNLINDFDRTLGTFFDDSPIWDSRTPSVDVMEEEKKYVLEADLPGMTEKDIDVKVEDNLLTISSGKEEKKEKKEQGYIIKERCSSSFTRSFVLPKNVDREKISATFKNGILTMDIAKSPEKQPKSIKVKVE